MLASLLKIKKFVPLIGLLLVGGMFMAFHATTIRGYDFIWAADSYGFKKNSDVVIATGEYPSERPYIYPPRPNNYPQYFSLFAAYLSSVTGISTHYLYYEWLIYLLVIVPLPIYLLVRYVTRSTLASLMAGVLSLTPFIVYREMEQPRAQISLFFLGPLILYLLVRAVNNRRSTELLIAIIWIPIIILSRRSY